MTTPKRGCGTRQSGAIYAEVQLSPFGQPLEFFLCDPPIELDMLALGVSAIGVTLIPRTVDGTTTWHLLDWVGSEHYPNVCDFLEETRRQGISRRLPRTLDFSKLTPESNILLIHQRAVIADPLAYHADRQRRLSPEDGNTIGWCPKELVAHQRAAYVAESPMALAGGPMCAGLFWEDVEGEELPSSHSARLVTRAMPSFAYEAWRRPDGVQPLYRPAVFASFPLSNLAVVRNKLNPADEAQAVEAAAHSRLPKMLVED